jgi:pyridoxamine 5'-phosphate oxidase
MTDPIALFSEWFTEAKACPAIADASAMSVATATPDAVPSVRILLLKEFDEHGFVFYTNSLSRKGAELTNNPRAALAFYWAPLDKQVRIEGSVMRVNDAEADAYFATRERLKQAGAWASRQSESLESRDLFEQRVQEVLAEYEGKPIPRPSYWDGFRLRPTRIEFWQQRDGRLHVRDAYTRAAQEWRHQLLYP